MKFDQVSGISYSQMNMIRKVLARYGLDDAGISGGENMYMIECGAGYRCLNRVKHGGANIEKIYGMTRYLSQKGFANVPGFIRTSNNRLYVKNKHSRFYMTQYIDGNACDFDNPEEVRKCIGLLSSFHASCSGAGGRRYFKVKNRIRDWPSIFNEHCESLISNKSIISGKRIKSGFDIGYSENLDFYHRLGLASIDLLNRYDYDALCSRAVKDRSICVRDISAKNFVKDGDGRIWILSLAEAGRDVRIFELGRLVQKVISRDSFRYSFDSCAGMIEAYNSIIPVSRDELGVLLAAIIFPYKFYKLGRRRYKKNKFWTEEKYMHKLDRLLVNVDAQKEFIECYTDYFGIDVKLDGLLQTSASVQYKSIG